MKTKFITCIYNGLDTTYMGGRQARFATRYRLSLLCLVNSMPNADFVCYTSSKDIEPLVDFFHTQELISPSRLAFVEYPLETSIYAEKLRNIRQKFRIAPTDRCQELQYMKLNWIDNEDGSYDRYYWIDAGLSHCGLIPPEYRITGGWECPSGSQNYKIGSYEQRRYFDSIMFQTPFLENLLSATGDKFLVCGKENIVDRWSASLPREYYSVFTKPYNLPDNETHVIGGLFGGSFDAWKQVSSLFNKTTNSLLDNPSTDKPLYDEEAILSWIYAHHKDWFNVLRFDRWGSDPNAGKVFYQLLMDLRFGK